MSLNNISKVPYFKFLQSILISLIDCSGLGSAFFVGFSGFLIYLIIIIYFRYQKGRSSRESYFENLLNGGLEASDLQQNFKFKTVECREERFYSVPDIDN